MKTVKIDDDKDRIKEEIISESIEDTALEIQMQLTVEDLRALMNFSVWRKKKWLKPAITIVSALLLLLLILNTVGILEMAGLFRWGAYGYFLYMLLLIIVLKLNEKRYLSTAKMVMGRKQSMKIDSNGICSESFQSDRADSTESKYLWKNLHHSYETRAHFFLFISSKETLVIPKRDMTRVQVQELSRLAGMKLGTQFERRG